VHPLIANFSWDQVLYYLIPLIWVLQYFLPGKKKGGEDAPERGEAADAAQERMRKIREEIRRRVEAQRGEGASAPVSAEESPQPAQFRPVERPEPTPQLAQLRPEPVVQAAPSSFDQPSPQETLQEHLREQQARLAESRKVREAALRRTKQNPKEAKQPNASVPATKNLRSEVFATLKSPIAARKAIVLSEILGEPRAEKPYS
tara:strand:- start:14759 stop:15367 length:609 start_codon:yes stop_codon:yes gene_type:complete